MTGIVGPLWDRDALYLVLTRPDAITPARPGEQAQRNSVV
jgi:hypothetical protein